MKKTTLLISALAVCLLGTSVKAEPWEYTGSVQLSFPNGSMPIDFTVPIYGVGHRSPTAPYTFSISMTQIVDVAQTLVGSITNPIPLVMGDLPTFISVFLGDFKLYPGALSTATTGIFAGDFAADLQSLEMLGTTVNADFVSASVILMPISAAAGPAPGTLMIFNDSGAVTQPLTAAAMNWTVDSKQITANGGTLSLVTPVSITTAGAMEDETLDATARLQFTFVPEPGVGSMLLAGSLLLAEAGRRRRRQARS